MKQKIQFFITIMLISFLQHLPAQNKLTGKALLNGKVKIVFSNMFNNHPVVLNDSVYLNYWGENFSLRKLKYYVSHCKLSPAQKSKTDKGVYLIDQADEKSYSISFDVPENDCRNFSFTLGVDSALNFSGAQTGALDPLNDMFWTWNTGYVMFKLEGTSPQSNALNNKIEYHIGGYSGINNVVKNISLPMPDNETLKIRKGKTTVILIEADLNKFWTAVTPVKIVSTPVCTSEGALAKQIASNYAAMFSIVKIINPE